MTVSGSGSGPMPPTTWSRPVALVVAAAFFMENLDATILSTATATIATDFEVQPAQLGIAVTGYLVAVAAFIPLGAWLAERWGARRVFLAAVVLFVVASVACAARNTRPPRPRRTARPPRAPTW
jgi:MFS family permease